MNAEDLLEKVYQLQNESNERDVRLEEQVKMIYERLDQITKIMDEQSRVVGVVDSLLEKNKALTEEQKLLRSDVRMLQQLPAQKLYESRKKMLWIFITAFVTAIAGGCIVAVKAAVSIVLKKVAEG